MKSPLEQNYYELLEVPRDATVAEIDRAYDRARAYYGAGSVAVYTLASPDELKLVQDRIDEAYLVLADEKARAEYDARMPASPDERPLHREVREAREKDAAREAEKKREPTPSMPQAAVEPPKPEPAPPPAPAAVEPAPTPVAAAEPPKGPPEPEPVTIPAAPPPPPREPTPMLPMPAVSVSREPTPKLPLSAVAVNRAVEGPIPPPTMDFPEPAPRTPPRGTPVKPPEAPPRQSAKTPDVPADAVFSGELLKRLRESQGLSLQEIADRTKIGKSHLENIEGDRHAALPAQVYLRGFLMSLARELRLDPLRVSKSYLEQMASSKGKAAAKPRS